MSIDLNELQSLYDSMTVKELAAHYHISERTMSRRLKEFGLSRKTDRTDISDDAILECYKNGMSINQIAMKYSCSHDTVTKRLAKHDISNTRGEGVRRHFAPTYEERWAAIKADLDAGISVSIVRDLHHIRMENLQKLMDEHGYRHNGSVLYSDLLDRIEEEKSIINKKRRCLTYLLAIKEYIDVYSSLPNDFALSDMMGVNILSVRRCIKNYNLSQFIRHQGISSWVSVLMRYLEDHNVSYETNNRSILKDERNIGKEMDFYISDMNIGIEVNPVGTHSVDIPQIGITDRFYHQKKSLLAETCNVSLVHMYDEDFLDSDRFEKIMNIILTNNKTKCGARSCVVRDITATESNTFLNKYHLQGAEYHSKWRYGLYYNDELCCVMTVGKPRYTSHDYEIIRYCVRPDFIVMGGFQKLFSCFLKNTKPGETVVSYMDLNKRFSCNNIYEKSGFVLEGITSPDYVWVSKYGTHTLKRYDTTKKKLVESGYDKNKTEKQIMLDRGYFRVYGAGSKRYVYRV